MCYKVIINRGDKEINTPREFEAHFGFVPVKHEVFSLTDNEPFSEAEKDECLCSANLVKSLRDKNIQFKSQWGDIYVGELDLVEAD